MPVTSVPEPYNETFETRAKDASLRFHRICDIWPWELLADEGKSPPQFSIHLLELLSSIASTWDSELRRARSSVEVGGENEAGQGSEQERDNNGQRGSAERPGDDSDTALLIRNRLHTELLAAVHRRHQKRGPGVRQVDYFLASDVKSLRTRDNEPLLDLAAVNHRPSSPAEPRARQASLRLDAESASMPQSASSQPASASSFVSRADPSQLHKRRRLNHNSVLPETLSAHGRHSGIPSPLTAVARRDSFRSNSPEDSFSTPLDIEADAVVQSVHTLITQVQERYEGMAAEAVGRLQAAAASFLQAEESANLGEHEFLDLYQSVEEGRKVLDEKQQLLERSRAAFRSLQTWQTVHAAAITTPATEDFIRSQQKMVEDLEAEMVAAKVAVEESEVELAGAQAKKESATADLNAKRYLHADAVKANRILKRQLQDLSLYSRLVGLGPVSLGRVAHTMRLEHGLKMLEEGNEDST